jgi:hypothetical protein
MFLLWHGIIKIFSMAIGIWDVVRSTMVCVP